MMYLSPGMLYWVKRSANFMANSVNCFNLCPKKRHNQHKKLFIYLWNNFNGTSLCIKLNVIIYLILSTYLSSRKKDSLGWKKIGFYYNAE